MNYRQSGMDYRRLDDSEASLLREYHAIKKGINLTDMEALEKSRRDLYNLARYAEKTETGIGPLVSEMALKEFNKIHRRIKKIRQLDATK